jgi:hypothetical protein
LGLGPGEVSSKFEQIRALPAMAASGSEATCGVSVSNSGGDVYGAASALMQLRDPSWVPAPVARAGVTVGSKDLTSRASPHPYVRAPARRGDYDGLTGVLNASASDFILRNQRFITEGFPRPFPIPSLSF